MPDFEPTLTDLARRNEAQALENRWLDAIEQADENRDDLLDALEALTSSRNGDLAANLAWTWLSFDQERLGPVGGPPGGQLAGGGAERQQPAAAWDPVRIGQGGVLADLLPYRGRAAAAPRRLVAGGSRPHPQRLG